MFLSIYVCLGMDMYLTKIKTENRAKGILNIRQYLAWLYVIRALLTLSTLLTLTNLTNPTNNFSHASIRTSVTISV